MTATSSDAVGPFLQVAVPVPLRRAFHYLAPESACDAPLVPGVRLRVPFGNTFHVGVLLGITNQVAVEEKRLKRSVEILDDAPLFSRGHLEFLKWAADYYHHPIGEVVALAMPPSLRLGRTTAAPLIRRWRLVDVENPLAGLKRAPRQRLAVELLMNKCDRTMRADQLRGEMGADWHRVIDKLITKRLLIEETAAPEPHGGPVIKGPKLTAEQVTALERIRAGMGRFTPILLQGVTGSGKTEVYIRAVDEVIAAGRQALVLIPEIGLTAQTIQRFRERIAAPVQVLHSALTDAERGQAWAEAAKCEAGVIIGTRSAIWTPLPALGLIIVDEEHDPSYKQQDGMRYSARDLALVRGKRASVPVLLGSATPSLETLHNANTDRYQHLHLTQRTGGAVEPRIELLDIRNLKLDGGLSSPLLTEINACLCRNQQVLIFINRRGYSPVLICHACGGRFHCQRCDTNLSFHRSSQELRCHRCGASYRIPGQCPQCEAADFVPIGVGTERVEGVLNERFPHACVVRIDSDSTRRKGVLNEYLAQAAGGKADILVGTQMLSKGHHFPGVGLVCVLDGDAGLYGTDFRAAERLAQTIVQVGGRAGRASVPGRVLVQTHHPNHPNLQLLVSAGYQAVAEALLSERRAAELPPYGYLVMLRVETRREGDAEAFLEDCRGLFDGAVAGDTQVWGPAPAPVAKVAGRNRWQLILQATKRAALHRLVDQCLPDIERLPRARRVRWSLDVDPQEML
jgi:primosomal protein N' (replication factor Y)